MIRATKGKSRSTNHCKDGWMGLRVTKGLTFGFGAAPGLVAHSLFFEDVFTGAFFSIFCDVGSILGRRNGGQNRFLGGFFAMLFSNAFWHRFFVDFWGFRP